MTANTTFYKCLLCSFSKREKFWSIQVFSTVLKSLWQQLQSSGVWWHSSLWILSSTVVACWWSSEMADWCQSPYCSTQGHSELSVRHSCVVKVICLSTFDPIGRFPWLGHEPCIRLPSTLTILSPTLPQPDAFPNMLHHGEATGQALLPSDQISTVKTPSDAKCNMLGFISLRNLPKCLTVFALSFWAVDFKLMRERFSITKQVKWKTCKDDEDFLTVHAHGWLWHLLALGVQVSRYSIFQSTDLQSSLRGMQREGEWFL